MNDCDLCFNGKPIYPDVKCCFNCARDADTCNVTHRCGSNCRKWTNKAGTNADRIRSMSDEELADFLDRVDKFACEACCGNLERCRRNNAPEPVCKRHYLEWLQQQEKQT